MEKIPTAKKFIDTKFSKNGNVLSIGSAEKIMIEFAKLHVQKALKKVDETISIQISRCYECGGVDSLEQSILNIYPLDNIK